MRALYRRLTPSLYQFYRIIGISAFLVLVACTGANIIDADVSDFRTSFARASEEQILRNILRARDQLPLHFSELQSINATIQQTASLSTTAPFGPRRGLNTRDTLTASVGLQNNPQFSVGTLETQEFTKGILSPIEPKLIKQFVDRGIDPRIILILFFSEVQLGSSSPPVTNSFPCMDFSDRQCYEPFFKYLDAVNNFTYEGKTKRRRHIRVNVYTELRPVGPPIAAVESSTTDKTQFAAKDLAAIDYTKFKLKRIENKDTKNDKDVGKYQLYSISAPRPVFCPIDTGTRSAPTNPTVAAPFLMLSEGADRRPCEQDEIFIEDEKGSALRQKYEIRSVYQMIQFLGQILAFQDASLEAGRCIVLGREDRSCGAGDVLFQVNSPRGAPMISTSYGGGHYFLVDGSCQRTSPCDHSTQVLDILATLLNTNKVAKDIPNPAVVQVVQ